jgi:phosphoribosylformylglycinamidine synthase I
MIKFGIISFPGTNCEMESVRAFKRNGMDAEVLLWNDPDILNGSKLDEFDGYMIAGGFSYEDRGRSGVVAAQDPIMDILKSEADKGKVVLGVCNGAQILVESGLIPGFDNKGLGVALAWNEMKKDDEIVGTGFYNIWCRLKNTSSKERSAFNDFDDLLHIPMAHGEGRFVIPDDVLQKLEDNDQIPFKYADDSGEVNSEFPYTPNGATASTAALCNPGGNVMAMMPHPERDPNGNGNKIFDSIRRWIEQGKKSDYKSLGNYNCEDDIRGVNNHDLEIYVRLIITDNSERTIEESLIRKGFNLSLSRYIYFGIDLREGVESDDAINKIMSTGELANFNKHLVYIKTEDGMFEFKQDQGLVSADLAFDNFAIAMDRDDSIGESKSVAINNHAGEMVKNINSGIMWNFINTQPDVIDSVITSKVLYNPHSMYLLRNA